MTALFQRKDLILVKKEVTDGTDAIPTVGTNAMVVRNIDVQPMQQTLKGRDILRAYFGNSEQLAADLYSMVTFECEVLPSGTAGTPPEIGALLEACGMQETISAGVDVSYVPETPGDATCTIYVFKDRVLHPLTGCRGSWTLSIQNQEIPFFTFTMWGRFNAPTDTVPGTPTYSGQKPLIANRTNTTPFQLHSYGPCISSLNLDWAASLAHRNQFNCAERILITDRLPAGDITMEAGLIAEKDWWTAVKNTDTGPLSVQHGQTPGRIMSVFAGKVQLTTPRYGTDGENITTIQANLVLTPISGNDEIVLTFS